VQMLRVMSMKGVPSGFWSHTLQTSDGPAGIILCVLYQMLLGL
jgi:hypothetical protein